MKPTWSNRGHRVHKALHYWVMVVKKETHPDPEKAWAVVSILRSPLFWRISKGRSGLNYQEFEFALE